MLFSKNSIWSETNVIQPQIHTTVLEASNGQMLFSQNKQKSEVYMDTKVFNFTPEHRVTIETHPAQCQSECNE